MVILDATIVNVALPSIQHGLHFSASSLQWIVNAYTLVFGGFLLLGGRASDLLGRQRLFIAGLVVFTGASLLNAVATSSGMLVGGRALQGLGAALLSLRLIPNSKAEDAPDTADVAGAVTVTAGLLVLVYGIVKAPEYGWGSGRTLGLGLAALVLLASFVVIELRSKAPLIRLGI